MSATAPAPRHHGLLDGLPAAMAATWNRTFPPACDTCGRGDQHLHETPTGALLCDEHHDDAAYDHEGDRR